MLKLLKNFTLKEWLLSACAFVFIVLQVWLDLTMPDYMSKITTLVQTEGSPLGDILRAGGIMLLCAFGSLLCSVATALCSSRISSSFSGNLRYRLFSKVQSFSMEEIGKFSTASLITRSTNDVTQIQNLVVMGLQLVFKAPIMAVWAILKIAGKEWQWTLATIVSVVVLLVVVGVCLFMTVPKFRKMQKLTDDVNRVMREGLTGIYVVRAYNAEKYQESKFEKSNDRLTGNHLSAQRTMAFMMPSVQLVLSGLTLSVYWIGASLINRISSAPEKIVLFSDMMVYSQYAVQVVMSFMSLVGIFMFLPRAQVSANRINDVLYTEAKIHDGTRTEGIAQGTIEFQNVSFHYPDSEEDVIQDITFSVNKGETVAIIGSTGCGKSTLLNLIPRFYDVTKGCVLVDGIDVREYTQKALRQKIGYVSQKAILFGGSVYSNIAYGAGSTEITHENVKEALSVAQATDFVEELPDKEQSFVAPGGTNFSGGQKQRLSVARSLAKKSEILLFDDSFSALDYKTDKKLRKELETKCADTTKLIIAQRIGTIRDADKIIVLDDGKIVGLGKHEDLLKTCEVYKQIALSQLSEEELQ